MRRIQLALLMLLVTGLVAVAGPALEGRQRAPEGVARAYLQAVERGHLDDALAAIDPLARSALRERVALQVHNRYVVSTVVLGRPSVWDRFTARQVPAVWVTVSAQVETITGDRWQSASTAPLVERDGQWYLAVPLFA
ncbi:MAG: hypothetical protein AB7K36_25570 [Chloroflexota bacterium]